MESVIPSKKIKQGNQKMVFFEETKLSEFWNNFTLTNRKIQMYIIF